jgi:hypothetical protein
MEYHNHQEGQPTVKDEENKETLPPKKGVAPKPRSSGRGLYITAIVMGVIIVLLLALYIYLSITHSKPAHTSIAPSTAITWISKG